MHRCVPASKAVPAGHGNRSFDVLFTHSSKSWHLPATAKRCPTEHPATVGTGKLRRAVVEDVLEVDVVDTACDELVDVSVDEVNMEDVVGGAEELVVTDAEVTCTQRPSPVAHEPTSHLHLPPSSTVGPRQAAHDVLPWLVTKGLRKHWSVPGLYKGRESSAPTKHCPCARPGFEAPIAQLPMGQMHWPASHCDPCGQAVNKEHVAPTIPSEQSGAYVSQPATSLASAQRCVSTSKAVPAGQG